MRLRLAFGLSIYFACFLGWAGCQQQPAASYTSREELLELAPVQQEVVNGYLVKLFGTPTDPHIRLAERNDEGEITYVDVVDPELLQHGRQVYTKNCAGCHGTTGDGNGPAADYLSPRPRDYRLGLFKFTSTAYGAKPHRLDLERLIREGARGTSMPAFPWLPEDELTAVVEYVIMLSRRGEVELRATDEITFYEPEEFEDEEVLAELTDDILPSISSTIDRRWQVADDEIVHPSIPEPPMTEESILAGQRLFLDAQSGCFKCHGPDGRGGLLDPEKAIDNWGEPLIAADLTTGFFHGGRRPVDIYRRIDTGINGRMPTFHATYGDDPEQMWNLVHFVTAVSQGREIPPLEPLVEEIEEFDSGEETTEMESEEATTEDSVVEEISEAEETTADSPESETEN